MEVQSVWLIQNKSSLEEYSPMNIDGSEFIQGVGIVPAANMQLAMNRFNEYLAQNKMGLIEAISCVQYALSDFPPNSEHNREIIELAEMALDEDQVYYGCGISSEALDCAEDDKGER